MEVCSSNTCFVILCMYGPLRRLRVDPWCSRKGDKQSALVYRTGSQFARNRHGCRSQQKDFSKARKFNFMYPYTKGKVGLEDKHLNWEKDPCLWAWYWSESLSIHQLLHQGELLAPSQGGRNFPSQEGNFWWDCKITTICQWWDINATYNMPAGRWYYSKVSRGWLLH